MPEVRFARTFCIPSDLVGDDPEILAAFRAANGLQPNDGLPSGRAYTLEIDEFQARPVVHTLNMMSRQDRENIAGAAGAMGDEIHRLAAFFEENLAVLAQGGALAGAAAGAGQARLTNFQKMLLTYKAALLDLQKLQQSTHAGAATQRLQAERRVHTAFKRLMAAYGPELDRLAPEVFRNKNRGNALSNAKRGITLASRNPHARPDPRLNVTDTFQARRLSSLGKFLGWAGNAAIPLDAALRGVSVYSNSREGGLWMREAAIQTTGFGLGTAAGFYFGNAAVGIAGELALASGLMVAGPVGWAVLGVVLGVGLLVGFGLGYAGDKAGQWVATRTWDRTWGEYWDQFADWAW